MQNGQYPPIAHFGVVVAGRPVMTEFRQLGPTHFVADMMNPTEVTDLTFFLLPNSPLPPNHGAVLYYSVPPFQDWQLLGSVTPTKQSAILRTSWSTNPNVQGHQIIQLGISIESLDSIRNLGLETSGLEERKAFAHKIALDLFNYMTSFSSSPNTQYMTIPTNLLEKWMERFEAKYKRDPNFMMKQG